MNGLLYKFFFPLIELVCLPFPRKFNKSRGEILKSQQITRIKRNPASCLFKSESPRKISMPKKLLCCCVKNWEMLGRKSRNQTRQLLVCGGDLTFTFLCNRLHSSCHHSGSSVVTQGNYSPTQRCFLSLSIVTLRCI